MNQFQKALIIQTAYIGDVILTTPLIEVLSKYLPKLTIDFLAIPTSVNIIESNPKIRKMIVFDKKSQDRGLIGLLRLGRKIRNEKYDLCLTPHRSFRSAYLTTSSNAKIRVGFDRSVWKRAFSHVITYKNDSHEIERNLSLLSALGIKASIQKPVIYTTDNDIKHVHKILSGIGVELKNRFFIVAPGSVWPTKRWPEQYYIKFCQILEQKEIQPILIGSQEDAILCGRIASQCRNTKSTAGLFSIRESYALIESTMGILTNDSSPLHLGMAAGVKVFAIFGPTVPAFGFAPFGKDAFIFEQTGLNCRPCAIHGGKKCPIKTFDCMESLTPELIASEVINRL